jgi:hypothetical protein
VNWGKAIPHSSSAPYPKSSCKARLVSSRRPSISLMAVPTAAASKMLRYCWSCCSSDAVPSSGALTFSVVAVLSCASTGLR